MIKGLQRVIKYNVVDEEYWFVEEHIEEDKEVPMVELEE